MGVPLLARGKTIGAITFSSVQAHRYYTPDDVSFAQELARRIALVLDNASLHREVDAKIAERKQAEEQQRVLKERMLALATTDPVTELPNHRALLAQLDQELERAQRYERACSLLFLDLDHFKALNHGYGHTAGDDVLYEFASLIRAWLRRIDTVGRWGGEEFVAILPELQADEALVLAEEVRAAVAAHTFSVGGGIHLTCSVGMASCPGHAQEREGLLSAADHAMYGANALAATRCVRPTIPRYSPSSQRTIPRRGGKKLRWWAWWKPWGPWWRHVITRRGAIPRRWPTSCSG